MTAGSRAALDEALRARLERPRRRPVLVPAIGAAAAAALVSLLWLVLFGSSGPVRLPGEDERGAVIARSWEDELFLSLHNGEVWGLAPTGARLSPFKRPKPRARSSAP